jgi:exodeoxyribonuclease VII small subunit
MTKKSPDSYQALLGEVEQTLRDLADPSLDLDTIVAKVERGYETIQVMQKRLDETKMKIETLTEKYQQQ